jgi:hypothetical protein
VLHGGLHEELTRVVDTVASVCEKLQQDFLDPTVDPTVAPVEPAPQSQRQSQSQG